MAAFRVVEDDVVQDYKCPERSREAGQGPVPIAACLGERTGPCEATERERGKLLDSSVACRCDYLIVRSHERVNCSPISTRKSGRGYGGYTRNPESYVATKDGHSLAQARGTPTPTARHQVATRLRSEPERAFNGLASVRTTPKPRLQSRRSSASRRSRQRDKIDGIYGPNRYGVYEMVADGTHGRTGWQW